MPLRVYEVPYADESVRPRQIRRMRVQAEHDAQASELVARCGLVPAGDPVLIGIAEGPAPEVHIDPAIDPSPRQRHGARRNRWSDSDRRTSWLSWLVLLLGLGFIGLWILAIFESQMP
jgi:hypothetical protein